MITLKRGVSLRSQAGAEATVIDAELRGRAIRCADVDSVRIAGLTVTRGFFDHRIPDGVGWGAGIYSTGNSYPTIADCILRDNHSLTGNLGGGIACADLGAKILNSQIIENEAANGSEGAGIYIRGGRVSNCLIRDNRTVGDGALAAGISAIESVIEGCWFENNRCSSVNGAAGAAIILWGGEIRDCTFIGNEARAEALGNVEGGAVWCPGDATISATISQCVFAGNRAISIGYPGLGGAISSGTAGARPTITNCTFLANSATVLYPVGPAVPIGALYLPKGGEVRACILAWTEGAPCSGQATMTCNLFYQNSLEDTSCRTSGQGNFSADPQFCAVDPVASRNFSIQRDSPCAPGNHPPGTSCEVIGAAAVGCETVSVERSGWSGLKSLYRKPIR